MPNLVKVVTETIGLNEVVLVILEPMRCRNCKQELEPSADFKYCKHCSLHLVRKWAAP